MQGCLAFVNTESNCKYKQLTFLVMRKLHRVTCAAMSLFPKELLLLLYWAGVKQQKKKVVFVSFLRTPDQILSRGYLSHNNSAF